jgi:cytidylate kinase
MIRVVTIDREYGSGAGDIARKLSERLGWELWDQKLTDEIARLMKCDRRAVEEHAERRDPLAYRLMRAFLRGSFEGTLNAPRLGLVDADRIREVAERVVRHACNSCRCVLVGRGSAYYLRDRPDAFHVFIYAPREVKVRRLQASGESEADAIELAETVDRDRAEYIRSYFDVEWPCRNLYHMLVNSKVGDETVVETIAGSIEALDRRSM